MIKFPNLGIISPNKTEHEKLYINREEDEIRLLTLIQEANAANISGCIPVCGSPGCGKSTFSKFLVHKINNKTYTTDFIARRIALDNFYNFGDKITPIDSFAFIDFIINIRTILLEHAEKPITSAENKIDNLESNAVYKSFQTKGDNYTTEDFLIIKDLIKPILRELAAKVQKTLTIFVDDIDLLPTHQLLLFVEIFSTLGQPENGIRIVFTARPVSIALVQHMVRHILNNQIAYDFHLRDINTFDLLEGRFNAVDRKVSEVLSNECIDHIRKICSGNNDRVMKNIVFPLLKIYEQRKKSFSDEKELHANLVEKELIPNILSKLYHQDKLPLIFVLLYSLKEATIFDKKFIEHFNENALAIRGVDKDKFKHISANKIKKVIAKSIEYYVVRRVDFDSVETLENIYQNRDSVDNSAIALTESGLTQLRYLHLTLEHNDDLRRYPLPVQEFIESKSRSYINYNFVTENPNLFKKEWK